MSLPYFKNPQSGFASILALVLMLAGIGIGTYLVQNQTNLLPKAAENPVKSDPFLGIRVNDASLMSKAKDLGIGTVRINLEAADNIDEDDQKLINEAIKNNFRIVFLYKPLVELSPDETKIRLNQVFKFIGNYQNIAFELGNEPNGQYKNICNFWQDCNPASFAQFIKTASEAIWQLRPNTKIIVGALDLQGAENGGQDLNKLLDTWLNPIVNQNSDKAKKFSFAIHAYHQQRFMTSYYDLLTKKISAKGLDSQIWFTEIGVLKDQDNPQELINMINWAKGQSKVEAVILHEFDSIEKDIGFEFWNKDKNSPYPIYNLVQENSKKNSASKGSSKTQTGGNNPASIGDGTVSCGDNPPGLDIPQGGDSLSYYWHSFCKTADYGKDPNSNKIIYCTQDSDCPQNNLNSSVVNPANSSSCYQFKEGNRCLQLRAKVSGKEYAEDSAYDKPADLVREKLAEVEKTGVQVPFAGIKLGEDKVLSRMHHDKDRFKDYAKRLNNLKSDKAKQVAKKLASKITKSQQEYDKECQKEITDEAKKKECAQKTRDNLKQIQQMYRVAKLYDVVSKYAEKNSDDLCVKADLGFSPLLYVKPIQEADNAGATPKTRQDGDKSDKSGATKGAEELHRLFICVGNSGDIKWRVKSNSGKLSRIASQEQKNWPTIPVDKIKGEDKTKFKAAELETLKKYLPKQLHSYLEKGVEVAKF